MGNLFAFFGLGTTEIILLAILGAVPLAAAAVVAVVVLVVVRGKKKDPGND